MTSAILKFRSKDKLKALVNNVKSVLLVSQQNKIEQWEVTRCLWRNPDKHKKECLRKEEVMITGKREDIEEKSQKKLTIKEVKEGAC